MNELRRALLDDGADDDDAPAELPPDLRLLGARAASAAALLVDHAELYRLLLARRRAEGPSAQIAAIALDAAGNLATVLQALRAREDLIAVAAHSPALPTIPIVVFDQLLFGFVLLTETEAEAEAGGALDACLTTEDLDGMVASSTVTAWLASMNVPPLFDAPPGSRLDDD